MLPGKTVLMKKSLPLLSFLIGAASLVSGFAAEPENPEATQSFLFIGNSFTFRHELKDVFQTLAKEGNPETNFVTERITYGGRDMFRHFELFRSQDLLRLSSLSNDDLRRSIKEMEAAAQSAGGPEFYAEYWKTMDASALKSWEDSEGAADDAISSPGKEPAQKPSKWSSDQKAIKTAISHHEKWISARKDYPAAWNYVVLQSWQDVSANPETGYIKYASKFAELAQQQGTKVVLYITAPYSQNKSRVTEPLEKERALQEVRVAFDLAKKTGALVVPVPLALYRLQKAGTDLTFRYQKDSHPNQYGAYLTACLLYAAVFDKSPEGLALSQVTETNTSPSKKLARAPDGNPVTRVFTEAERTLLQRTAWETMQAFQKGEF